MPTCFLLPLILAAGQAPLPFLARTFAVGGRDAFLMLPPQTVADADARQLLWTADGSQLVVLRSAFEGARDDVARSAMGAPTPPDVLSRLRRRQEIVAWSVGSHKVRTLVAVPAASTLIDDLRPMGGTDRVVFETSETIPATATSPERTVEGLSMLMVGTGGLVRVATLERAEGSLQRDYVSLAPTRPLGAIEREFAEGDRVRFFGADGKVGDWLRLPFPGPLRFDAKGRPGVRVFQGPKGRQVARFQTIDPATGALRALVDEEPPEGDAAPVASSASSGGSTPRPAPSESRPLLEAFGTLASIPNLGPRVPCVMLFVRGGKPEEAGVVTTDGGEPILSPRLDAVAYVGQGVAMVRPLVRMPRSVFESARDDALRALALSNAKQAALGLLMYSADNDDDLPPASVDLWGTIGPYVKSREILDGFHYTFGGGKQTAIDSVATMALGYVDAPGGRAVAYADGHAKWVPNP